MTISEKYQELLRRQVKKAGEYLIVHADDIVSPLTQKTDFTITIDLHNGDRIPTIRISEEVFFPAPIALSEVTE